ncbi:hypothetical protein V5O48_016728 [Marasmius crinis-equi]|uniref:Uncharacterized protein n=1 Tax=Marasmius crinis-equi TaxID=585013 RepID=A0ABR3EQZ3_9AGAR
MEWITILDVECGMPASRYAVQSIKREGSWSLLSSPRAPHFIVPFFSTIGLISLTMSNEREIQAQQLRIQLLRYSAAFAQLHHDDTLATEPRGSRRFSAQIAALFRITGRPESQVDFDEQNGSESGLKDSWGRPLPPHLASWLIPSRQQQRVFPTTRRITVKMPTTKKKVMPKWSWTIHSRNGPLSCPAAAQPKPRPAPIIIDSDDEEYDSKSETETASVYSSTTTTSASSEACSVTTPTWWRREFDTPMDVELREMEWRRSMGLDEGHDAIVECEEEEENEMDEKEWGYLSV